MHGFCSIVFYREKGNMRGPHSIITNAQFIMHLSIKHALSFLLSIYVLFYNHTYHAYMYQIKFFHIFANVYFVQYSTGYVVRDACPPANELIAAVMQCSMDAAAEEEVEEGCRWVIYAIKTRHVTFRLTLGSRGDVATILQMGFSSSLHTITAWGLAVKLLSCESHGAPLMRSQHWYRYWLVAVRQQAIIWTNADPDLWHLA